MIELAKPVLLSKRAGSQCPFCLAFNRVYEFYDEYIQSQTMWGDWIYYGTRNTRQKFCEPKCCKCGRALRLCCYRNDDWVKGVHTIGLVPNDKMK